MNISSVLSQIEYKNFSGNKDTIIDNITYDSRKVSDGFVFVAVKGFIDDGHKYIKNAITNGASAILCEEIPEDCKALCNFIVVENARKSMAHLASVIYDNPSANLDVIGVTGTNGKTSITYLLNAIFEHVNKKSATIGTLGVVIDKEHVKTEHTTPESSDIQYLMNKMLQKSIELCMMEVSSHALELDRVSGTNFNIGIFSNLTRDHLDFHKTMENYYQAKKKLFYLTSNNNIVNVDDEYGNRLYKELKRDNVNVYSYGIDSDADIRASNLRTTIKGTKFDLNISGIKKEVYVKTPGKFSVLNSLAAIGSAYCIGIDIDLIIEALGLYKGVDGRFEIIHSNLDSTVILDFAHTPDGLEKIMETVSEFATKRKIVMFGAGGDRDISRRAPMGEIAGKYCDLTILTSDNPRFENPYDICEEIAKGVKKYSNNYKIIVERDEAIYYAIKEAKFGDIIILAGKSTEPYQDLGIEKVPYDEKSIAIKMIKKIEHELEKDK
ncbi:UDP-N-acetylmuramoyl-L-alanyl-D-glutamate--2,6-diaminopimelate ligase [Sedimentibacter sp. zth1]|uniref:UDP-N-acetylmuramoyl-L-alanyl-D-glutamate--2, 6-diaminopimelate ligase n=1 Tax=Sedimentibacter sp. zth1 TaxID=2816908 RepID=UPI001A92449F|nr:UDP-N-acetylmuramoyl-L-alanyl-D-glutamate--2,6-diaminopimelate ligase [Sedimentibacter sp. zth1]QSX06148.1 UDP-N-acetylmuramoyl-L-alanyl-D-glutamate--2,6-diaminopimelate ligase [Sedimentibacter sp. zth1]